MFEKWLELLRFKNFILHHKHLFKFSFSCHINLAFIVCCLGAWQLGGLHWSCDSRSNKGVKLVFYLKKPEKVFQLLPSSKAHMNNFYIVSAVIMPQIRACPKLKSSWAAPSVEAHHRVNGPDTGWNSRGRRKKTFFNLKYNTTKI